jgi:hypothetical protein
MGLFDTIRRAVGGDNSSTDGDERTAEGDPPSDDGPDLLDTATLDPTAFREYAEHVVDGADPLMFHPDALARLDAAIEASYDGRTAGDDAGVTTYTENTVRFGSYLGELLVRAYDGEWVQSDGRWGVAVAGPDDEVGVVVFDVAARSFADKPVFAAVVTRLESELELDSIQSPDDEGLTEPDADETDVDSVVSEPTRIVRRVDDGQADERDTPPEPAATDARSEATAGDTAGVDSPQATETEPTQIVRRIESESEGKDPETTDSVPDESGDESTATETTEGDSTTHSNGAGSATDTADEQSTAETPTADSTVDAAEDGPTADTTDAVETAADADDTVTADKAAAYIDEAEPGADSAISEASDEIQVSETPPEDSAVDAHAIDTPTEAETDTAADEAATDTADDGGLDASTDGESLSESLSDASPDAAPDAAAPETTGDESPADTADVAVTSDTTRAGNTSAPVDTEASEATENALSQGATADETAGTTALDEGETAVPTDGDFAASLGGRPWEPGTVRAEHAETAVEFADFWGEHDLDFSPASLSRLDDLVDAEWDDERFAATTFGSDASFDDRAFTSVVRELGGYFGEVLVRELGGEWTDETDHEAAVVVGGPDGQFAVPIFEVAITSLRKQAVFGRSYDALLEDIGRDGPTR